ncbi:YfhO family protein [candidate division WOR-3 bacterium]|nr:YfhO family protein [candidate division WOR-3 bacterium]
MPESKSIKYDFLVVGFLTFCFVIFYWKIITHQGFFWFDYLLGEYPRRAYLVEHLRNFDIPLWNSYSLGGHPWAAFFFASGSYFYPFTAILSLFLKGGHLSSYTLEIFLIMQVWISAVATYFLLRELKLTRLSSIFGAIIFSFSYPIIARIQHTGHLCGIIWIPLIFYLLIITIKKKNIFLASLCGLFIGISIMGAHPQSYIFLVFVTGVFLLYSIVVNRDSRKEILILSIIIGICAFLISAHRILPEVEYALLSKRMSQTATGFIPTKFISNIFIPWLFGKGIGAYDYWGGYQGFWMFVEYGAYVGIIPLLLLIFSKGLIKEKKIRFFWYLLGFSLLFVYGKNNPLHKPVNLFLPGLRFYSRFLPYFALSSSILASFSLDNFAKLKMGKGSKLEKIIIGLLIAVIVGFVFFGIWKSTHTFTQGPLAYKYSIISKGWILFLIFLLVSTALILIRLKGYLKGAHFQMVAILIIIIDLFSLGMYFNVGIIDPDSYYQPNNLTIFLREDYKNELFRVASGRFGYLYANSRTLMYKIPSTEGKLENSLNRFNQLKKGLRKKNEERYFDLYNVKYEIRDTVISGIRTQYPKMRDTYLPRAYIVYNVKELPDVNIIPYLSSMDFNPEKEVILERIKDVKFQRTNTDDKGRVVITDYTSESIEMNVSLGTDGYLVLSEHYYPGWKAYVDGERVKILRANYLFRAIPLGPGEHMVKFIFSPKTFQIGIILSLLGVLFIIVAGISVRLRIPKIEKEKKK